MSKVRAAFLAVTVIGLLGPPLRGDSNRDGGDEVRLARFSLVAKPMRPGWKGSAPQFVIELVNNKDQGGIQRKYPPGTYKVTALLAINSSPEEPAYVAGRPINMGGYKIETAKSNALEVVTGDAQSLPVPDKIAVRVAPEAVTWQAGEALRTRTIRIEAIGPVPVRLLSVKPSTSQFSAKLGVIEEGKTYEVTVTPRTTGTPVDGMLHFDSMPDLASLLDIPVVVVEPEHAAAVPSPKQPR